MVAQQPNGSEQAETRAATGRMSRRSLVAGAATVGAIGAVAAAGSAQAAPAVVWPNVKRPADLKRIVDWSAAELSVAIRRQVVSCVEVMTAYLDHIDAVNPAVNAIVSLRPRADLLAEAAEKDRLIAAGTYQGWMHGFPHAVKDQWNVKGLPTTVGFFGQPGVPVGPATSDALLVERIRAAGAIFIGKTNLPEFGLGSHTYNKVFGTTGNAYNPAKSAGGSSGGAAVAVALRMLPVADGSDFFGSLRNPPGWNNVLGLRPSLGRIPELGGEEFIQQGGVTGPIARDTRDLSLLLSTMAGYDARAPLTIDQDPATFTTVTRKPLRGAKVAWMADLGGYLPIEPEVLAVTGAAIDKMRTLGAKVDKIDRLDKFGTFGNADLWPTWLIFRHWLSGALNFPVYANPAWKPYLKPETVYEVEGLLHGIDGSGPMTAQQAWNGSVKRTALYQGFRQLFESYDYVLLPTAQVMPFDCVDANGNEVHWPQQINGVQMSSYHRWMEVTAIGTLLGAPTLAMPAGFGPSGLPIGLQVIGRNHDDAGVIGFAAAWEQATQYTKNNLPPLIAR
ncbi:MAG TPA: amidase [Nocardioides sp.]|nr:amidase [Nocardioides sp.]